MLQNKKLKVNIDSVCFSGDHLETFFIYDDNFEIQIVKSKGKRVDRTWLQTFGRTLHRNVVEAKIIHTTKGLTIPLKRFSSSQKKQTIEFAGLYGYDERSELLSELLKELQNQFRYERVTRIDVAIDFEGKIPSKIIRTLCEKRVPLQYKNTTYYKTPKEGKTNRKMDIKIYDKAKKSKLDYPLERLEFVFKNEYLKDIHLLDLGEVILKIQKTIKLMAGIEVEIKDIFSLSRTRE